MKDGKAPRRPSACNLSSIPVLQVVSYACSKSRKAAKTLCFTENACRTSWSRRSNGSIVEVERRKPNWKGVRAFNVSRSGESLLDTSRSIILLGTDVIEIGRYARGSVESLPGFGMATTIADVHTAGRVDSYQHLFIKSRRNERAVGWA